MLISTEENRMISNERISKLIEEKPSLKELIEVIEAFPEEKQETVISLATDILLSRSIVRQKTFTIS